MRIQLQIAASAALLIGSSPLRAQGAPPAASTHDSDDSLGERVVTAQRREQNLKDVPLSVSVTSAEQLDTHNFTGPEQLPYLVPSLQLTNFQASPGATNFSIRGIGTSSFSHLIEPSVATVIDGVVMGRPEMGVMEFSDLERVEVLNGPQGMLFGKNASAGLVNIVTTRPKLGVTEFLGRASYGDVNASGSDMEAHARGTVNLPFGANTALRLSAHYSDTDGLIDNTFSGAGSDRGDSGRSQYGVRARLFTQSTDQLSFMLGGDFTWSNGMGTGVFSPRYNSPTSTLAALDAAAGIIPSSDNVYQASDANTDLDFKVGGAQGEVAYELSNGLTLTDILAYRSYRSSHTIDFDLRQIDILDRSAADFDFNQISNELRLTSPAHEKYDYQFGLYYYTANSDRHDVLLGNLGLGAPPPGISAYLGLLSDNNLDTESYAGYGQGTYRMTDRLALTAGGRFTHDRVRLEGSHDNGGALFTIAGVPGPVTYTPEQSADNLSWRLSAQYEMTDDINSYATVARGYKGPGFNLSWSGVPGAVPVGKETSMSYEVGIKSTFMQRVLFNASVYYEQFDDFQTQAFAPTVTAGGSFLIQNAGKLEAQGVETSFTYIVGAGLTVSGAASYNEASYKEFQGAPCYTGQTAAQGCSNGVTDASGNRLANAPRWAGTLGADYEHGVSPSLVFLGHGDLFTRSSVNFDPTGDPQTAQAGYGLFNASLGLGAADKRWKAAVFCRNCFDKRYVTFIQANPVGPGDYSQTFAVDSFRTVGVAVDVKF